MLKDLPIPSTALNGLKIPYGEKQETQKKKKRTWLNTPLVEIKKNLCDLVMELMDGYSYLGECMKHGKKETWEKGEELKKKFFLFSCSDPFLCPVEGVRIRKRETMDMQVGETEVLSYEELKSFTDRWGIEEPEIDKSALDSATRFRVLKPSLWSLIDKQPCSKVHVYDKEGNTKFYSEKIKAMAIEFTLPKRISLALQEKALEEPELYWKVINKLFEASRKVEQKIVGDVRTGGLEVLHLGSSEWAFDPHVHFHNIRFIYEENTYVSTPVLLKQWRDEWKKEGLKVFKKLGVSVSSEDESRQWNINLRWLDEKGVKGKICYELRPWAWDAEKVLNRSGFVSKADSLVFKGEKGKKKEIAIADIKDMIRFIEVHRGKDLVRWSGRLSNSTRFKLFLDMGLKPKIELMGEKMKCVKVESFTVVKRDFKNKKLTLKFQDNSFEEIDFKNVGVVTEREYSQPSVLEDAEIYLSDSQVYEICKRSSHISYEPPRPRKVRRIEGV